MSSDIKASKGNIRCVVTNTRNVVCGMQSREDHPKVYLTIVHQYITCPYCATCYYLADE